jgi:hypothetical protein
MKICSLWILTALIAMSAGTRHLQAQEDEDGPAITARVHGTFVDRAAGLGVLSGDMTIVRFEVRDQTVTAIGRIVGALADSGGDILGPVDQELAVAVRNIESTCNQLRMDLAAMDAEVLDRTVHFDGEVAAFDSRDGGAPRALGALCTAGKLLEGKPTPDAVARALNDVVATLKAASVRK